MWTTWVVSERIWRVRVLKIQSIKAPLVDGLEDRPSSIYINVKSESLYTNSLHLKGLKSRQSVKCQSISNVLHTHSQLEQSLLSVFVYEFNKIYGLNQGSFLENWHSIHDVEWEGQGDLGLPSLLPAGLHRVRCGSGKHLAIPLQRLQVRGWRLPRALLRDARVVRVSEGILGVSGL